MAFAAAYANNAITALQTAAGHLLTSFPSASEASIGIEFMFCLKPLKISYN
jgi:hypothetical protein